MASQRTAKVWICAAAATVALVGAVALRHAGGQPLAAGVRQGSGAVTASRQPRLADAASAVLTASVMAAAARPGVVPPLPEQVDELEPFLARLTALAEQDPERALVHVERGIEAIDRLSEQLGTARAARMDRDFAERMQQLADRANRDVSPSEVESLVARYQAASDEDTRDRLFRRYLAALGQLGPVDRYAELRRIQQVLADDD